MKWILFLSLAPVFLLGLTGCSAPTEPVAIPSTQTEQTVQTEPSTLSATLPADTEPQPSEAFVSEQPEPADDAFVRVTDYIPTIQQELIYATADNFTGQSIYDFTDAYLRYGTVKKLAAVSEELAQQGLYLKIWDAFRPVSAQFRLWEIFPNPTYVANPTKGHSSHSRGNTIDLTLVNAEGNELEMPTGFDDFSAKADRDYSDCNETETANAMLLQNTMENHGFSGYFGEWWHFSDSDSYPVEEVFQPLAVSWRYADCNEYINLRTAPDTSAESITRIPVNGKFQVLALYGDFFWVDYQGLRGYVLGSYTQIVEDGAGYVTPTLWTTNCEEYISLRKAPDSAEVITRIPSGKNMLLKKWDGKYALVSYAGQEGYVLTSYIKPFFPTSLETVSFTATYTHEQMLQDLQALAQRFPDQAVLDTIGQSELGLEIPVLRIGDPDAEYHVLLQGAIHGREHMTAWLLSAMADYWLSHDVQNLGDICWHILPMTNPDGVTISQTGYLNEIQGKICKSDVMAGYATGLTNYAAQWKANGLGVDINRNFPCGWDTVNSREEPSSQQYRGTEPFSSAEARALRDYTLSYSFDVTISYHAQGSVIYWEYGNWQSVKNRSYSLGMAIRNVTGYPLENSDGLDGAGYKDWVMEELGIPSLTIEVGCGDTPLAEREMYSIFARNQDVLPAIAKWLQQ